MHKLFFTLICIALSCCSAAPSLAVEFYVSPDGNDAGPGTPQQPFKTLFRARDAIRNIPRDCNSIHVWLKSGTWNLNETFTLGPQDSGTPTCRIIYSGMPGHEVRISGGMTIAPSAFKHIEDKSVLSRLAGDNARTHILAADLKSLGITDFGKIQQYGHMLSVVPAPLELFCDDQAMPLAHYPNSGSILVGKVIDPGSKPRYSDYSERGGTFEYSDPRHGKWAGQDDVWLQGTFNYGYADDIIRIESIDPQKHEIKLSTPHMYGLASGKPYQHYVALNILEELDSPGEWYLDRARGILYFWPVTDIHSSKISVSMLEAPIVSFEAASYISLENVIIESGRGMGIYIESGQNNIIRNCTVRNMGTSGIFMGQGAKQTFPHITHNDYEGVPVSRDIGNLQAHIYKYTTWERNAGKEHQVLDCVVYNTGAGGIYLSGGSKKNLTPGNSIVSNCLIHDYNRRNKFLWAGINVDGCGNTVSHCEIYNSNFQGIYVHGNDHLFEYNYLHDLALDSDDTSAWYIGRDPSDRGNLLRHNYFENVGRTDRLVMGVYLDDGSCGVKIQGNVFYKTASYGTVFSNSGHDVEVSNNIFIESMGPAVRLNSMWCTLSPAHVAQYFSDTGLFKYRLLELLDIRKPPYSTRYPQLADYMDYLDDGITRKGIRPRDNTMTRNVIYNCPKSLELHGPHCQFEEQGTFVTSTDPGFVNFKSRNFSLKDDSIVYKKIPGFKRIPFEKIGRIKPASKKSQAPQANDLR